MPETDPQQTPDGWTRSGGAIERTFEFGDFVTATAFIAAMVPHCERANHHPEWRNVYATVEVRLTTHDAGNTVTDKDLDLAATMNRVANAVSG